MKNIRAQVARNLQATSYICSYPDYSRIAGALQRGRSREEILAMPELIPWPLALAWLKETI